ncbi:MAG: hypothetical protein ABIR57_10610 [Aeromicrobium sp.]
MSDWLSRNTDLVALFLAVVGLIIGFATVLVSVHQARLSAYTRMHELLISPDTAKGRRILFVAYNEQRLSELGEDDWHEINRALATYDTLGVYFRRRIVSRRLVLGEWFHPLSLIREPANAWMRHRVEHGVRNPWPSLTLLLDRAEKYHLKQGCCQEIPAAK